MLNGDGVFLNVLSQSKLFLPPQLVKEESAQEFGDRKKFHCRDACSRFTVLIAFMSVPKVLWRDVAELKVCHSEHKTRPVQLLPVECRLINSVKRTRPFSLSQLRYPEIARWLNARRRHVAVNWNEETREACNFNERPLAASFFNENAPQTEHKIA